MPLLRTTRLDFSLEYVTHVLKEQQFVLGEAVFGFQLLVNGRDLLQGNLEVLPIQTVGVLAQFVELGQVDIARLFAISLNLVKVE